MPVIARNRRAAHDYTILSRFEAGIVLYGHEVKSIKSGHARLTGAFITVHGNEVFLVNAFIPRYTHAGALPNYDPYRTRKLLLHRREIRSLIGKSRSEGLTIIPLSVYTKGRYVKVECAVARGKKSHDKRETLKRRDADRAIRRALRAK